MWFEVFNIVRAKLGKSGAGSKHKVKQESQESAGLRTRYFRAVKANQSSESSRLRSTSTA